MIRNWYPSLVIATSTVAAFVAGRLLAALVRRRRTARWMRAAVLMFAVAAAVYFYVTPSSRYALLLPVALAAGHLTFGHARMAPRVFDE